MEKTVHLSKTLGALEVFTITSGTMIGAGIFVLPGILAQKAGPAAVMCFALVGFLCLLTAFSVCELATAMPRSGGGYYFVSRSMGSLFGSIVGLGSMLALIFKGAFAFVGAGDYLAALIPATPTATALALCVLLITLNVAGTSATGYAQNLVVTALGAILFAFIVQGLFSFDSSNFNPFFRSSPAGFMQSTGMVFMAYMGMMGSASVAEEVKNPQRNIPLGILTAIVFVTMLYMMIMLVTQGILRPWALAESTTAVADAAQKIAGAGGLVVMVLCGLMATLSTGNSSILASSRFPFAMARDNQMPQGLARVDPHFKTPMRSILLVGGIVLALIAFLNIETIVKYGSSFNIIIFALVNFSLIILRRVEPSWYKPTFRSPLFPWLQITGALGSLVFMPFLGRGPVIACSILVVLGSLWHLLYVRGKSKPGYGLRDSIRTAREKTETIAARSQFEPGVGMVSGKSSWQLLVLLWSRSAPAGLMTIAGHLSRYFEEPLRIAYWDRNTDITLLGPYEDACRFTLDGFVDTPEPEFRCSLIRILAPSRSWGFLETARSSGAGFVLMELPDHYTRLRWELKRIAEDMPCDMAFLSRKPISSIDSILMANANPADELKIRLAGAIAARTGASLTVLRIYPEGAREMARGDFDAQLQDAGALHGVPMKTQVVRSEDVVSTIIRESGGYDLLVLGGVSYSEKTGALLGELVEKVIAEAECPVLVVKAKSPFKTPLARRILKRLVLSP